MCHAGDARAYLLRDQELTQLTRDHNVVNQKIDSGEMTELEAQTARMANPVTQGIGPSQVVSPTIAEVTVEAKDLFMLCSDGLSGFVDNEALAKLMSDNRSNVNLLLNKLIDAAGDHGSTDNITVVLAEMI